jgi:predicted RNA polymerase sigma factor
LIEKGTYFLNQSIQDEQVSTFHLEAMIASHHTQSDSAQKWQSLLELYDQLLQLENNPIILLNRAYVMSKVFSPQKAIVEIEDQNNAEASYLYFALLGELYLNIDSSRATEYFEKAIGCTNLDSEKKAIQEKLKKL